MPARISVSMQDRNAEEDISEARFQVNGWLVASHGRRCSNDTELIKVVCDAVKAEYNLDLVTNWNPSACVFDARWQDRGSPAEGLEKPSNSDTAEHASLLACASIVRLLTSLQGGQPGAGN